MIIDVNGYIGKWPYWENKYAEQSGDMLVQLMDKNEVDKTIIISTKAILYDVKEGNERVFAAAGKNLGRLIPSITVNPLTDKSQKDYIQYCFDRGAKMIRLYPLYHGYSLTQRNVLEKIMQKAVDLHCMVSIPFRLFMNFGLMTVSINDLLHFINEYPEINFLIDAFNYSEFYEVLLAAKEKKNIFLSTTTLTMYQGVEKLVNSIGAERLMMGTAAPLQNPACNIVKIQNSQLSKEEIKKILGKNAKKTFDI